MTVKLKPCVVVDRVRQGAHLSGMPHGNPAKIDKMTSLPWLAWLEKWEPCYGKLP